MEDVKVNLACGDCFLDSWLNYDYAPNSTNVKKINLLKNLPLDSGVASIVYSSHYFEHIPENFVNPFLSECYRIMKPGGMLRLVMPDFDEFCASYLSYRGNNEYQKAEFLLIEMIDQCVRTYPGGKLGNYYSRIKNDPSNSEMISFIKYRTGHDINIQHNNDTQNVDESNKSIFKRIINKLEWHYIKVVTAFLPPAFRKQNIKYTAVGGCYTRSNDFHTVKKILNLNGFLVFKKWPIIHQIFTIYLLHLGCLGRWSAKEGKRINVYRGN